ncbi:MAG: hypothetical protein V4549_06395 [Bacteroidota bacterium]
MIQDELSLGFRWYNDIEKQGRYKSYCLASCDYKRLTPLNSILPFQFDTHAAGIVITSWSINCMSNDTQTVDLSASIASKLYISSKDGIDHIFYNGSSIGSLVLPCGYYYSVIETSQGTFYSEIFYCTDITDTSFSQMDFSLFTAWRWYNNSAKQNRYKTYCKNMCNYYRLCGDDALLPFMFRKPETISNPKNSWVLRDVDGSCEHNLDMSPIVIENNGDYDYVYYTGGSISNLPCGKYESILTINGISYYSELIEIVNTISSNTDSSYLLQETGSKLLQETSFGILLE